MEKILTYILLFINLDVLYYNAGCISVLYGNALPGFGHYITAINRPEFKYHLLEVNALCVLFDVIFLVFFLINSKKKDQ